MATGRPEEYKEIYIDKVYEYLDKCEDQEIDYHKTRGAKTDSYEKMIKVDLPSIDGFSKFIEVSRKSIYNWKKNYPDFAYAIEQIEIEQKIRLMNGGLSGMYNPIITKLMLTANHDMIEKSDITSGGDKLNSFTDGQIDRIAGRVLRRARATSSTPSEEVPH